MEKFDVYILKPIDDNPNILSDYNLNENWWKAKGFINLSLEVKTAQSIKANLLSKGIVASISPIKYRENKHISFETSKQKVLEKYNTVVTNGKKLGKLKSGPESPIWYSFFADDYALQEEGYVPGYWGCYIDKITGEEMDKKTIIGYQFL